MEKKEGCKQEYDAFLSHSHKDAQVAFGIKEVLCSKDLTCYCYEDESDIGRDIMTNIFTAIQKSRKTIFLLSKDFIKSKYLTYEYTEALHKQCRDQIVCIIPIMYNVAVTDLPASLANRKALEYKDEAKFWSLLEETIRENRPTFEILPAGDVGVGLAWSFFYGYLNLKLPTFNDQLSQALERPEVVKQLQENYRSNIYKKMIILSPESCHSPAKMEDFTGFKQVAEVSFFASRAGNAVRDYKSYLYEITNSKNEVCYATVEYATPALSMYEMHHSKVAQLSEEELDHQRRVFVCKLIEILEFHPQCQGKCVVLDYADSDKLRHPEKGSHALADLICENVFADIQNENQLTVLTGDKMDTN